MTRDEGPIVPRPIDFGLDLRGETCPHPVLMTLDQISRMRAGQVLEIVVDCASALVNLPIEIKRHGHKLIVEPVRRGAEFMIVVEVV